MQKSITKIRGYLVLHLATVSTNAKHVIWWSQ